MEEALQSIARAFARNREAAGGLQLALLALLAAVALLQAAWLVRRLLARATALRRLAADRGLAPADLKLARALARRAGVEPVTLLTHLDQFERATSLALSARESDAPGAGAEPPEAIRRLRLLLGFDRLPAHAPLLSSRELAPGLAVAVGAAPGAVCDVGEASFTVELPQHADHAPGQAVALTLAHAREARYALRCPLLASRPGPQGTWHLVLGHDEAPQRIQQRAFARVAADGPLVLRPGLSRSTWPTGRAEVRGRLVDLSGGGALVTCRTPLPAGLLARASFALGDALFSEVRAVVLSSERAGGDGWRLHLEFTRIPEAERDRLVAAVEQAEVRQASARRAAGA